MIKLIKLLGKETLDLLFPQKCYFCDTEDTYLCANCSEGKFEFFEAQECHVCRERAPAGTWVHSKCVSHTHLDGVLIVAHYTKSAQKLLHEIKYNLYYAYVPELGKLLSNKYQLSGLKVQSAVAVPLSRKRLWWRGFNQAELLARCLQLPVRNLLERYRDTRTQVGLDRAERLANLKEAFRIDVNCELPESVLLIDDVMTTGATLEECAFVLRSAGVAHVYALVFARGD